MAKVRSKVTIPINPKVIDQGYGNRQRWIEVIQVGEGMEITVENKTNKDLNIGLIDNGHHPLHAQVVLIVLRALTILASMTEHD
jgi:hypothetical protein